MVLLEDAGKLSGSQKHLIEDQRALLLFRAKKYAEALKIWRDILPTWPVMSGGIDHGSLYACQRAGRAAGLLLDWTVAVALFQRGRDLAEQLQASLFVTSFQADEAYAVWKSGQKTLGLERLVEAVGTFELLNPEDENEFQVHRVKKCLEQVVKWCRFDAGSLDEENVWEPPAGMCSQIEADDKLKEIPAAPLDLMWFFLADIEAMICGPGAVFDLALERAKKSEYATVRTLVARLALRSLFVRRDFTTLIEAANWLAQAIFDAKTQLTIGKSLLDPDAFLQRPVDDPFNVIEEAVVAALILLAENVRPLDSFFSTWEQDAKFLQNQKAADDFFVALGRILAISVKEVGRIMQNESEPRLVRCVAALRMCIDRDLPLLSMLVGQAFLFGYIAHGSFKGEIEAVFGNLVRTEWMRRTAFPAAFHMPQRTIPAIQAACNDGSKGLRLIARIFLQARFAVTANIPSKFVAEWQKLAAE